MRVKEWRLAQLEGQPGFTFHRVDISDRETLAECLTHSVLRRRLDAVINLAARAGVRKSVQNPWVYVDTNVTGTLNLLELCRQHDDRASLSSLPPRACMARTTRGPYREDADTNGPLSPYAASKKGAEALCYTYHYLYDIDVTVFRYLPSMARRAARI